MRKLFIFIGTLALFGLAPHALAQGFVPLAPIPGLTEGVTANQEGLANFFNNLYKYLIGIAAILAIIEIIWGGLEISTKDSVSANKDGKERIKWALFGLVLVLSPVLVFSIINPSILNLSVNLPELDTRSAPAPTQSQNVSLCSSPQLTPQEREACQTTEAARAQGVLNLTPEQQQAVSNTQPIVQETAERQVAECGQAGGKVACGRLNVMNGQCTRNAIEQQSVGGSCTVLINGCACVK